MVSVNASAGNREKPGKTDSQHWLSHGQKRLEKRETLGNDSRIIWGLAAN
ncbi:MAG: hypothetical protein WB780_13630 [Candidatus Acidiferrales bacterium]